MGFNKNAVVNIQAPPRFRRDSIDKKAVFLQKIRQLPEVSMVCTSEGTPAAKGHRGTDISYFKGKNEIKISSEMHLADENFIPLYELKLLAGRNLQHSDTMTE